MGAADLVSERSVVGTFFKRMNELRAMSWAERIASMFSSNQASERYPWLGEAPRMRKWEGPRYKRELRGEKLVVINDKFEATIEVDVDDLRRDKTGQIQARISELAESAAYLPDEVLTALLNANGTAYDGDSFYTSSRTKGKNVTVDNDISISGVSDPTKPTVAEAEQGMLDGIVQIIGQKDDEGRPMNKAARQFLVMVPMKHWAPHIGALKNSFTSASTSNTLKEMGFQIAVVPNTELTATDEIHIFRIDAGVKGLIWQDEVKPMMQVVGRGSEYEFDTDRHKYGVKRLGAGAYGRPEMACRVTYAA